MAAELESALRLVAGDTDESVFAGLLVLAKHVPAEVFVERKRAVVEALQAKRKFLRRLLGSGKEYQRVALTILASFCSTDEGNGATEDDSIAKGFDDCAPLLETIIIDNDDEEQVKDAVFSLGRILFASPDAFKVMSRQLQLIETLSAVSDESLDISRVSLLKQLVCLDLANKATLTSGHFATICALLPNSFGQPAFSVVCELCAQLLQSPSVKDDDKRAALTGERKEGSDFSLGVGRLACGVLGTLGAGDDLPLACRSSALSLAKTLCAQVGEAWPFFYRKQGQLEGPSGQQCVLFSHFVSAEVAAQVTNFRYRMIERECEDEGQNEAQAISDILICFSILEHMFCFFVEPDPLVAEQFHWSQLPAERLLACRDALLDSFSSIARFVCLVKTNDNDYFDKHPLGPLLLSACAKCLSCWLSDGPDERIGQVEQELLELPVPASAGGFATLGFLASRGGESFSNVVHTLNVLLESKQFSAGTLMLMDQREKILRAVFPAFEAKSIAFFRKLSGAKEFNLQEADMCLQACKFSIFLGAYDNSIQLEEDEEWSQRIIVLTELPLFPSFLALDLSLKGKERKLLALEVAACTVIIASCLAKCVRSTRLQSIVGQKAVQVLNSMQEALASLQETSEQIPYDLSIHACLQKLVQDFATET